MALPWTMPEPERRSPGRFHCPTCEKGTPAAVRAGMHCGFMPREKWAPGRAALPPAFGGQPYEADVCPGWLVRQPAVIDGATAYTALEAGTLERFDPDNLRVVNQAALVAQRAFNLYQIERQEKNAARLRGGG